MVRLANAYAKQYTDLIKVENLIETVFHVSDF